MRKYTAIAADVAQRTALLFLALEVLDPNNSTNTWTTTIMRTLLIPSAMGVMNTLVMQPLKAMLALAVSLASRKNAAKPEVAALNNPMLQQMQAQFAVNPEIMDQAKKMAERIQTDPALMGRIEEAMQAMMTGGDPSKILALSQEMEAVAQPSSIQEILPVGVDECDSRIAKEPAAPVEANEKSGVSFMKAGGLKEIFAPASVVKRPSSDPMLEALAEQLVNERREQEEDADELIKELGM